MHFLASCNVLVATLAITTALPQLPSTTRQIQTIIAPLPSGFPYPDTEQCYYCCDSTENNCIDEVICCLQVLRIMSGNRQVAGGCHMTGKVRNLNYCHKAFGMKMADCVMFNTLGRSPLRVLLQQDLRLLSNRWLCWGLYCTVISEEEAVGSSTKFCALCRMD
jgi:hypothetical protein